MTPRTPHRLVARLTRTGTIVCTLLLALAPAPEAEAAPSPGKTMKSGRGKRRSRGGNFGLGASLGDPMPLSMKLFLHPNHALQWDGGWMPLHHGSGGATMSYLWHPMSFVSNDVMDFLFYVGVGLGLSGKGHDHYGYGHGHGRHGHHVHGCFQFRLPVFGLAFHWRKVPMDTAIEGAWSPCAVEWGHGHSRFSAGHGDVSVKARYYF